MGYARDDIERVRAATDLVELVGEVTKIRRTGRSSMAVCPFHGEKTASMSVDGVKGLYNCFGCSESGDVFKFVQASQSLNFTEALELLARRANITLKLDPKDKQRRSEREAILEAIASAVTFYHERLKQGPDAGSARSYLRSRGYDLDVVEEFGLGFSPASPSALVSHLSKLGVKEAVMVAASLGMKSRQGRLIDRFRGRVMFPIFDVRGDAVGFGARLLDGDGPKYLNSSESPVYQKSRLLYGLNWAKAEIVRSGEAVIVEGYTDVIAMHAADRPVAVATCGTAFGERHLELLRRFTERVVLAFDADEAGTGAALRGFELDNPVNLDLRMALMPGGGDPADLVQEGRIDEVQLAIDKSIPLIQFRLDRELTDHNLAEPEARGRAIRRSAEIIARHPDQVVRHEYAVLVSRRTGVDLSVVTDAVRAVGRVSTPAGIRQASNGKAAPFELTTGRSKAEAGVLRLLMANDPLVRATDVTNLFATELLADAYAYLRPRIEALDEQSKPDLGSVIGDGEDERSQFLRSIAMERRPLPDAADLLNRLRLFDLDDRLTAARASLDRIDPDSQPEVYSQQFKALLALEQEKQRLRDQA